METEQFEKERIQNWLNANRLQLPLRSFNLDSDSSITRQIKIVKRNSRNSPKTLNAQKKQRLSAGAPQIKVCTAYPQMTISLPVTLYQIRIHLSSRSAEYAAARMLCRSVYKM